MPGNTIPQFLNVPQIGRGAISVANTNLDGSGTLVNIVTGGKNGTIIQYIRAVAKVTTTAGMIRLYIWDVTTNWLYKEIPVTVKVPSATVSAFSSDFIPTRELILPEFYILKAAPEKDEAFNVFAFGGDL